MDFKSEMLEFHEDASKEFGEGWFAACCKFLPGYQQGEQWGSNLELKLPIERNEIFLKMPGLQPGNSQT